MQQWSHMTTMLHASKSADTVLRNASPQNNTKK